MDMFSPEKKQKQRRSEESHRTPKNVSRKNNPVKLTFRLCLPGRPSGGGAGEVRVPSESAAWALSEMGAPYCTPGDISLLGSYTPKEEPGWASDD